MVRKLRQSQKSIRDISESHKTDSTPKSSKRAKAKSKLAGFFGFFRREFHPIKAPAKGEAGKILNKNIKLKFIPDFVKNAFREIQQVTWPGAKETVRLTVAVLIFATVFSIFIALLDFGLDKLFREVIIN